MSEHLDERLEDFCRDLLYIGKHGTGELKANNENIKGWVAQLKQEFKDDGWVMGDFPLKDSHSISLRSKLFDAGFNNSEINTILDFFQYPSATETAPK